MTHASLRDTIARAIRNAIAAGVERSDLCDAREIERLADAVATALDKVPAAGVVGWTVVQPGGRQAHDIGDMERIDWIEAMATAGRVEIARSILGAGFEFAFHARRTPPRCTVKPGTLRAAIDAARLDPAHAQQTVNVSPNPPLSGAAFGHVGGDAALKDCEP